MVQIVPATLLGATLSCDHRAIDGATGAQLLAAFKHHHRSSAVSVGDIGMAGAYDVIIVGGGPGGYVAAIRAAQLGLKTAVVEREHLGGICLNWGCIPTKALLRSAEIYHYAQHAKDYGLRIEGKVGYDAEAIKDRSRKISAQLNAGVGFLLKKNKVDVIWGEAVLTKPGEVKVGKPSKPRINRRRQRPGAFSARGPIRRSTSLSQPGRGRASCRGWSRTASASGLISRR